MLYQTLKKKLIFVISCYSLLLLIICLFNGITHSNSHRFKCKLVIF